MAIQQLNPQFFFKIANLDSKCSLRNIQRFCSLGDIPNLNRFSQIYQLLKVNLAVLLRLMLFYN
ncbi:MAG: hypothetical protein NWS99_01910, partial [Paracoccaceae bacterium]|nr:hypothetical protein [Paracoccaceae bacterium]